MISLVTLLALLPAVMAGDKIDNFLEKYLVQEMLTTRDGVDLHTVIGFPREYFKGSDKKYPTLIDRSPYGYGDMEWITLLGLPFDYVGIGQDIRGTEKSYGNYSMWTTEENDSRDLGDWIVSQPWSDGRVFTVGASADGLASLQTPKSNPPWLKGQYLIWCPSNVYSILLPNGAYKQKTTEDWLTDLGIPNDPWTLDENIQLVHENEMHTDYWAQVEVSDEQFGLINFPSAFYAGWYDLFKEGTIKAWEGYNTKSNPAVRGQSLLFIDPCGHCLEAGEYFPQHTVEGRSAVVLAQMLEVFGIRPVKRAIKQVTFYVMSSTDEAGLAAANYWTTLDAFPETKPTDFFLNGDGTLGAQVDSEASSAYKVDPSNPIPTLGGNNLPDSIGGSIPCGPLDQSPIDSRSDVLTFDTAVYTEELVMTGSMTAELYVSSDAIDTDFMVRISDVYNDEAGTVRLLADNAVRMRWRENNLEPMYLESGTVYKITVELWNISYVMAPGHQLRVAVQSSNFPRFSVNQQSGILLADPAYPGVNVTATNTLFHSAQYPSKVSLPLLTQPKEVALPMTNLVHNTLEAYPQITPAAIKRMTAYLAAKAKHM